MAKNFDWLLKLSISSLIKCVFRSNWLEPEIFGWKDTDDGFVLFCCFSNIVSFFCSETLLGHSGFSHLESFQLRYLLLLHSWRGRSPSFCALIPETHVNGLCSNSDLNSFPPPRDLKHSQDEADSCQVSWPKEISVVPLGSKWIQTRPMLLEYPCGDGDIR